MRADRCQRGVQFGDERVAAVDIDQACLIRKLQGASAGCGVAGPLKHLDWLAAGRQPLADVVHRARNLPLKIHLVIGNGHVKSGLVVLREQAMLDAGVPQERVGVAVAGDFHMGQAVHAPRNVLQLRTQCRMKTVGRCFAFDHRHGLRDAVFLQNLLEQHFCGKRTASKLRS
ncbi:hypothetical protein D3C87_1499650 [compost metagenome]